MTSIFIYLVVVTHGFKDDYWNVTPMPNMDVCEQFRETIKINREFFETPPKVYCTEVKTDKPVNPYRYPLPNDRSS